MNKPNKLISEKSPYLLQHSYNPVEWFPWGDEAFEKAKSEDKPIFLSIGYSTCHWCHVMEKESFEDEEVAALMNDSFVSIKVDREERPDIDGIYMTVCQVLTGSGGWPLTIIMTPDKKPFFAGTYFPKSERFGRMGMLQLLPRIKELWQNRRSDLLKSAEEISNAISKSAQVTGNENLDEQIFKKAFSNLKNRFDPEFGGFGTAPKFPTPHNLTFLLRYYKRYKDKSALEMVEKTLTQMRLGGIYDHIGFGFHRYSTDQQWLVPHFEKMLYDQALISNAYVELYQLTKNEFYKKTAEEIFEYVLREMTDSNGGFYSAEDADSEGEEGRFYLWTKDELQQFLNEDAEFFIERFHIEKNGNWIDSVNGGLNGTNIPHLKNKLNSDEEIKYENIRVRLFNEREKKIHPYKDDKILTDWNSLMISSLCKASQAFDERKYYQTAKNSTDFILSKLRDKEGRLLHRFRDGEAGITAHLDDYAFLIQALIDLYETEFEIKYLETAFELNEYLIKHFWDNENGGFFFISDEAEKLIVRQKDLYDGAIPSGNSIAVLNLLRLSRITGNTEFEIKASLIGKYFSQSISNSPSAFTQFLCALDFAIGPSNEIVIVEGNNSKNEFVKKIRDEFNPNKVVLLKSEEIEKISDYVKDLKSVNSKTTVYICKNFVCDLPITDADKLVQVQE